MTISLILLFSFFAGYFVWFANRAMRARNQTTSRLAGAVAKLTGD